MMVNYLYNTDTDLTEEKTEMFSKENGKFDINESFINLTRAGYF